MSDKIINLPLADANPAQLLAYVTDFLNIEVPAGADEATLRATINRAQPGAEFIFAVEAPAEPEVADVPLAPEEQGSKVAGSLGRDDPKWVIEIPTVESTDGRGGADVLVGVNGRAWQIKRGAPVTVPHRVVVALDNAVGTAYEHDDQGEVTTRSTRRFSYNVHERPTQEAIDAWHERVGAEFCA